MFKQVTISQDQLKNQIYPSGFAKPALYLKKQMQLDGHFPCPAETDPYVSTLLLSHNNEKPCSPVFFLTTGFPVRMGFMNNI